MDNKINNKNNVLHTIEEVPDFIDDNAMLYNKIIDRNYKDELTKIYNSLNKSKQITPSKIKTSESLDEATERFKLDKSVIQTFTDNIKADSKLKEGYAKVLIGIFCAQLIFFNLVFILCGFNILKYSETTLNIFITGGIIEVVAIIKIIVSYLFKDNISNSLNSILEKNKKDK